MAAAPTATTFNTPLTANSCAMFCTATVGADPVMLIPNATLILGSAAGTPIGDFLRNTYASAAAVDTAFRNLLGEIVVRQVLGGLSLSELVVVWVAAGPATAPALQITGDTTATMQYEILIRLAHTVIR